MSNGEPVNLSSLRINRDKPRHVPAKKKSNATLFIILGVIVVVVILFFILKSAFTSAPVVDTSTVMLVYPSQANQMLVASGYVVAQRKAAVASKGTGRLEALNFHEGDQVKKGQVIARIESDDIQAAISQAKANLEMGKALTQQAKAELTDASVNFDRAKSLIKEGSISQMEFDMAEARFKRATAAVESGEAGAKAYAAAVRAAEVQMENTLIRAPFDGTILTKNADVGEVVAPFGASISSKSAVVTMADMSSLEVEADVSESNIQKIKSDQPCEITLDAFPEKRYRGIVNKIVPTVDRAKATVMTKVRFLDRDERVLPEMSAKVAFLSEAVKEAEQKPKVGINPAALLEENGKKFVFILKGNRIVKREVRLGVSLGSAIEVVSGVTVGDQVVVNPLESFSDGMTVKTK